MMNQFKRSKINQLLSTWPSQAIYASSWLNDNEFPYDLVNTYRKSGWLKSIGNGAVAKAGDKVSWEGGIYALQTQLRLPIHVGGKSALLLRGQGHFIPQGKGWLLNLFAKPKTKLSTWFKNYNWGVKVRFVTNDLFSGSYNFALTKYATHSFEIEISAPERAILEHLSMIPNKESFEEGKLLMEGLVSLRPKIVEDLLKRCKSIKVKRLFLFLAETCNHTWFNKINTKGINLGKGKRVIEKKGSFIAKYGITVPKNMVPKHEEDFT